MKQWMFPCPNLKVGVAKVLREEGYINDYQIIEDNTQGTLRVELKYGPNNEMVLSGLRRVSKPGLRKYVKADDIPKVLSGLGISILSTSKGVITDREARRLCIGERFFVKPGRKGNHDAIVVSTVKQGIYHDADNH